MRYSKAVLRAASAAIPLLVAVGCSSNSAVDEVQGSSSDDIAVLKGDDTGAPLDLYTKDIAEKFVELYWRQSRPFQVGGDTSGLVLQQNTGRQAAIISKIVQAQQECGS